MQDAVIVSAVRTAVGKAPRGRLSQVRPDEMGAVVIAEALKRAGGLAPALVDDVIPGCASVAAPKSEEMIGMLSLHTNGALTVKSVQGELSVLDQDHILLASLPPNQAISIPSAVVSGKQRVMIAQVGVVEGGDQKSGGMNDGGRGRAGLPILIGNAAAILLNAGVAGYIVGSALVDDDSDDHRPLCR